MEELYPLARVESSTVVGFVQGFKSKSTRLGWQHGYPGVIWRRRFYDRFLRCDVDDSTLARGHPPSGGLYRE